MFILFQFSVFGGVFNKTIIPLALVGYQKIITNLALRYLPSHVQRKLME